jgi:two-component system, cell cycle response regulator DivK
MAAAHPAERPAHRPLVLLVEDHEDTRQMYAEFLQAAYEVRGVPDARAALVAAAEHPPDIVVTDVSLPGMDGFELTRRLRTDRALGAPPVICLSGLATGSHETLARAAGCARVIQKPCLPDALADAIAAVLNDPSTASVQG